MHQLALRCVVNGMDVQPIPQLMQPNWWLFKKDVVICINEARFRMGFASGAGCNCLIDSLRQCLGLDCDVARIRQILDVQHPDIVPGDYLELHLPQLFIQRILILKLVKQKP